MKDKKEPLLILDRTKLFFGYHYLERQFFLTIKKNKKIKTLNSENKYPQYPPPPKKNPSPPRSVHASTLAKCLRSRRSRVDRKPLASEEAAHAEC